MARRKGIRMCWFVLFSLEDDELGEDAQEDAQEGFFERRVGHDDYSDLAGPEIHVEVDEPFEYDGDVLTTLFTDFFHTPDPADFAQKRGLSFQMPPVSGALFYLEP